ncbi:MAG TPA: iron ABC transporter substrate-binding protein [Nitriliruptorales bacterium]|nr:iron ABC transporter substrate-binding protein [Nitriliruptorales bacterium]
MTTAPTRTLLALVVLAAALGACGSGTDELIVYSGRGENLVGPLLERFAEDTGVPIAVRYDNSAELALLIAEEGERTPADVFLSQSPGAVGFLAEQGLLRALPDATVGVVDPRFRSDRRLWVGVSGRQRVLVYNQELVAEDQLPESVFDLTAPRYRGQVGVAPANASFQDFVTAMQQRHGRDRTLEWLRGMAENDAPTYANNNAILDAVSRGEIPMGLVNHYYNHRFLAEDPELPSRNHVFPGGDIGALVIESTVSVLSDDERAVLFVEYMLSERAQRYFAEETFEYPLVPGVEPAADLPPLETLTLPEVDIERLGGELKSTLELIERSGLQG